MKKKLLILMCTLMATITASAHDFEIDGIYYNIHDYSARKVAVTYRGTNFGSYSNEYSGSVTIPSIVTYSGTTYSVTCIYPYAFINCVDLASVEIPNSITEIGYWAFGGCSGLASVEIPNSVTKIDYWAFGGCSGLTSVTIPNSVTEIGNNAFGRCNGLESFNGKYASEDNRCLILDGVLDSFAPVGLTSYTIPNSVTYIGNYVFCDCDGLTSIEIPNSVTSIGNSAFQDCRGLTSVEIPNSVTSIGNSAFQGCSDLASIKIPKSLSSISIRAFSGCISLTSVEIPNSIAMISSYAFQGCSGLISVEIPNSVTVIGTSAFQGCSGLTSIDIPNSLTFIASEAFSGCISLTSVTVNNSNPTNISLDSDIFDSVPTSTCTLYVPEGSRELYAAADQWCDFANIVEFSNGVQLTDGDSYTATEDQFGVDINYTRNFKNTEWQPLYVPFNMSYGEWSEYADVAEVHNVRGYDTDGDGEIDDIVIEFNKLNSGEIIPNVPYVIRAKDESEVTFKCTGKDLLAAPAEEGTVECSSTKMVYSFHGVYEPKRDMFSSGAYHLSGGAFHQAETDAAVLPPNRFYLMVTPKDGGYRPSMAPRMIRLSVDGEDSSSIEVIEADAQGDAIYYDMMGRQVVNPEKGIYIQNGKKVYIK